MGSIVHLVFIIEGKQFEYLIRVALLLQFVAVSFGFCSSYCLQF